MDKKVLVVSGSFMDEGKKILEKVAEVKIYRSINREELMEEIKEVDGIVLSSSVPFDERLMEGARKLKVIGSHGIGVDNIDIAAATKRKIFVTNTPNVMDNAVADLTLGLIITCVRRILQADRSLRAGRWRGGRTEFLGKNLAELTLGIIGLGSIGSEVAKRAKGFGMKILYHKRHRLSEEEEAKLGVKYVSFEDLLRNSDIVTIHVPLTPETRGMIGKKEISVMKKSAFVINTARGGVIDEKALCDALKGNQLAGAALDVFTKEPIDQKNPLLKLDNVILTPHIAAHSEDSIRAISVTSSEDVAKIISGERPKNLVNPEVLKAF